MEVELIHQVGSTEGNAIKMYLNVQDVPFKHTVVDKPRFKQYPMLPVLVVNEEVVMTGFDTKKLSNIFNKQSEA